MSDWVVVPCLLTLRAEFNALAPARDKGADGTIGDTAHTSSSDHTPDEDSDVLRDHDADAKNEVHALDIDVDLKQPGVTLEMCVQRILAQARAGDKRLKYLIFNRRIWSASTGWAQRTYMGSDPHTNHAHFSASYTTSQEARTDSWHLEELDMPLSETELDLIEARAKAGATAALNAYATGSLTTGGGSRDGAATTILARTKYLANDFAALVVTGLAAAEERELTPEELEALGTKIAAAIPDELAEQVANELATRLTS